MIKWAKEMYFDQHVKTRKRRIIRAVKARRLMPGIYCIALSTNPENLLDVIRVDELKFPYYERQEIYVLGLALGRESAVTLVAQMIDEVYRNTGDVKVRDYYQDRWNLC